MLRWRQFHYDRVSMWQGVVTVAAVLLGISGYLSQNDSQKVLVIGLTIGYAVLGRYRCSSVDLQVN